MMFVLVATLLLVAGEPATELRFRSLGGLPLVAGRIGDVDATFVVDTGAHPCVVDDDLAHRLGLVAHRRRMGHGGAGTFVASVVDEPPAIRLAGTLAIACREMIRIDLEAIGRGLGERIDGVVGADFFVDHVVHIDYDTGTIRRGTRASLGPPHGVRIPLGIVARRPYVEARLTVGRHREVRRRLLVDTGSMDGVADALLEDSGVSTRGATALGLGQGAAVRLGRFERVSLGALVVDDVPGSVGPVSLLGAGFLARFDVELDYADEAMYLAPREPQ